MIRPVRLFLLIGLLLASGGLAQPPSAALDYISGASLGAEAVMERSLAELRRSQLGLSGSLGIDPTLNYFINYDTVDPATFDFFLDIDLGIDYRFDLAAIIADRRDLVRSEDRYFDQRRRDVETALLIHTALTSRARPRPWRRKALATATVSTATCRSLSGCSRCTSSQAHSLAPRAATTINDSLTSRLRSWRESVAALSGPSPTNHRSSRKIAR